MEKKIWDVIVVGAGPAGLTAGLYLSRARLSTLILSNGTIGGQLNLTHEVANYPGVENISGYGLANIMKKQAKSFGVEFMTIDGIKEIATDDEVKKIHLSNNIILESHAVILAPGGRPRMLNVEGEASFGGKGISYCATCDGDFFTDKRIVVVGGGNAALEEAVSLTKYASNVTIVHMLDHFQAFPYAIEEAISHPKIDIRMETVVEKFHGNEKLEAVSLKDLKTGSIEHFPTDGTFIFIGYQPNTEFLRDLPILNKQGEIIVNKDMQTTIPGIFAAGDSTEKKYRQISTAIGDGTIAALSVAAYVHEQHSISQPLINQSV